MIRDQYIRRAKIVRLVDGDTCVLDFDMGMSITVRATVRLFGINTPEVRGPEKVAGHAATAQGQARKVRQVSCHPDGGRPGREPR